MGESKTNSELDYIVWQYLEKETPSIATDFQKLKNLKTNAGIKITLNSIYDVYTKNKPNAAKRQNENEMNKSPVTKKACLCEDENGEEDNTSKMNEKENETKEGEKSFINGKPVDDKKLDLAQESDDKNAKPTDEKALLGGSNLSTKVSHKGKPAKSQSNNKKRKGLLPKPKGKKTLLAAPFAALHQNEPNFYYSDDVRKALLPEPAPLIPTVGPSGRKTLLAEPLLADSLYSSGRNERKPLLSDLPPPAYSEDERGRKPLLSEPVPLFSQNERSKKPLLMEPVPPPLMQENARIDRGLLSESPPLTHLYPETSERMALLNYPSMSDQLDALYRRERKSLLDEPPMVLQDFLDRKKKESLLVDPASDSRGKKVGLLDALPLPIGIEDMNRKKRVLLPDRPSPFSRREYAIDPIDLSEHHHLFERKETSLLPKPLQEYDESSLLYTRRIKAEEHASDSSKGKEAWLAELEMYLKTHLCRSSERVSSATERSSSLKKPIDTHDYEEMDRRSRIASHMNQDSYAYYMQEKNAAIARQDYFRALPESLNFLEKAMADKSGVDFTRNELVSRNEALLRNYEEELKSIGINLNSEMNSDFRRANKKDFHSIDHNSQRRLYERFGGKMGFL